MNYKINDDVIEFYLNDNKVGYIICPKENSNLYINKVFVMEEFRSMGLASKMMHEIYNYAIKHNLNLVYNCSYAKAWYEKNSANF